MVDNETIAIYDAQAEAYANLTRFEQVEPALLAFMAMIKTGGNILDLGCGPGHDAATMRKHGLVVDPVDASAKMVRMANETYDITARQGVFETMSGCLMSCCLFVLF